MKQLLNKLNVLTAVVLLSFLSACVEKSVESDKLRVIFETDIGNDIDDALALDMLYKMVDDIQTCWLLSPPSWSTTRLSGWLSTRLS